MTISCKAVLGALLAAAALSLPFAATAGAAPDGSYVDVKVNRAERPSEVVGADERSTTIAARMLVPAEWRRVGAASDRSLGFMLRRCNFRIVLTARLHLDVDEAAAVHLAADLPAEDPFLLESGARGASAYRVVRVVRSDRRTQLIGRFARPLQRADDGRRFWGELTAVAVAARSCHSGAYRNVLGPQLANTLHSIRFTGFSVR
jgi:hypothetical protein